MNRLRPILLVLAASAAAGSATDRSEAAGSAPIATTSTAFLTIAEARQATRREVLRIARRRDEDVKDFEIKWCRRRSGVRVGCRYEMWFPDEARAVACHGGSRVVERSANRHVTSAWRYCILETDG